VSGGAASDGAASGDAGPAAGGGEDVEVVRSLPEVVFADGSRAAVDLVRSDTAAPEETVFAALVLLEDAEGRQAVVYSPRRAEWAAPGGAREEGESPRGTVVREVLEETGLRLDPAALRPCGWEAFRPLTAGRWPDAGGRLQLFRAGLDASAPPMRATEDDVTGHRWVTPAELRDLCGGAFWWPLVERVLSRPAGAAGPAPGRG
jgi:8-oxo-dGTP pyrophosphatase MutT (NUDIX family)